MECERSGLFVIHTKRNFRVQIMFALLRMTALVGGADYDGDFSFTGATEFNPADQQAYVAPSEFYRNEAAGDGLFTHKTVTQNNVGGIRGRILTSYIFIVRAVFTVFLYPAPSFSEPVCFLYVFLIRYLHYFSTPCR